MPSSSFGYLFGPLVALAVVGVLALILRWAFSRGHSLVEPRVRQGSEQEYGLLVAIASPGSYAEGEILRLGLVGAGLRATLAHTADGPRLMVFSADEAAARRFLAQH